MVARGKSLQQSLSTKSTNSAPTSIGHTSCPSHFATRLRIAMVRSYPGKGDTSHEKLGAHFVLRGCTRTASVFSCGKFWRSFLQQSCRYLNKSKQENVPSELPWRALCILLIPPTSSIIWHQKVKYARWAHSHFSQPNLSSFFSNLTDAKWRTNSIYSFFTDQLECGENNVEVFWWGFVRNLSIALLRKFHGRIECDITYAIMMLYKKAQLRI